MAAHKTTTGAQSREWRTHLPGVRACGSHSVALFKYLYACVWSLLSAVRSRSRLFAVWAGRLSTFSRLFSNIDSSIFASPRRPLSPPKLAQGEALCDLTVGCDCLKTAAQPLPTEDGILLKWLRAALQFVDLSFRGVELRLRFRLNARDRVPDAVRDGLSHLLGRRFDRLDRLRDRGRHTLDHLAG